MSQHAGLTVPGGTTSFFRIIHGFLEYSLDLHEGWNLISVPIDLVDPSVGAFQERVAARRGREEQLTVWLWDASEQRYKAATEILPLKGYWIFDPPITRDCRLVTIIVRGRRASVRAADLLSGWNLVGGVGEPPYEALSLPLNADPQGAVDPGIWLWDPCARHYDFAEELGMGMGYWLRSSGESTVRLAAPGPE